MTPLNATHDPARTSWVASANDGVTDFPIQNLPFAVFRRTGSAEVFRGGVAIGDQIVDLAAATAAGVFTGLAQEAAVAASASTLNAFMAMGNAAWSALRAALSDALSTGSAHERALRACLPTSASNSARTTRCYPTTNGCRSATTAARRPWAPAGGSEHAARRDSALVRPMQATRLRT